MYTCQDRIPLLKEGSSLRMGGPKRKSKNNSKYYCFTTVTVSDGQRNLPLMWKFFSPSSTPIPPNTWGVFCVHYLVHIVIVIFRHIGGPFKLKKDYPWHLPINQSSVRPAETGLKVSFHFLLIRKYVSTPVVFSLIFLTLSMVSSLASTQTLDVSSSETTPLLSFGREGGQVF